MSVQIDSGITLFGKTPTAEDLSKINSVFKKFNSKDGVFEIEDNKIKQKSGCFYNLPDEMVTKTWELSKELGLYFLLTWFNNDLGYGRVLYYPDGDYTKMESRVIIPMIPLDSFLLLCNLQKEYNKKEVTDVI